MSSVSSGPTSSPPSGTVLADRFALGDAQVSDTSIGIFRAKDRSNNEDVLVLLATADANTQAALQADLARAQRAPVAGMAKVLAFGKHGEQLFIVSETGNGHCLRQLIDAKRTQKEPVGGRVAHGLLGQIATTLSEAYKTMAHGALNPETVVVGRDGRVSILFWGVARGLPGLVRLGSADNLYAAPEVAQGGAPSAQADVFSLGGLLYEMLTATPPVAPLRPPSQLVADLSPMVDAVVSKSRGKNPLGRQGTPQTLVNEIAGALKLDAAPGVGPSGLPGPAISFPGPGPSTSMVGPGASSGLGIPRVTGQAFNVAAAAGVDSDSDRWLIQKGKLDFGPFSLAILKAEIARGAFGVEDVVVDTDSGERWRLGKHPMLGDFVRDCVRKLEAQRRANADASLEKSEKKKGRFSALVIVSVLGVVAVGGGLYFFGRETAKEAELAERVGEADIDQFLKGVKLEFNQPRKPSRSRPRTGGGSNKSGDEFDDTQVLGDVSKGGGDEVLGEDVIQSVMTRNYRGLIPCVMAARSGTPGLSQIDIDFVIQGSGKVSAVKVNGQKGGSFPGCVLDRMRSFKFPSFDGNKTIASWSMSIR
jgi:serine/threonine protein kinase